MEALNIRPDGIYVDGTLGRAGHSREIVQKLTSGRLICIDRDMAAIDAAKEVVANTAATPAELQAMVDALDNAAFALRLANGSGTAPKVKTHDYVARGATMAFGRSTVSGVAAADLLEQGFCWGTSPEPTVLDNRTTAYYNQNGRIYHMTGLEPSTIYYVRAYALTKTYAVGYGDVVKVITLPMDCIKIEGIPMR